MSATLGQSSGRFLCIVFLCLVNAATTAQEITIKPRVEVGETGAETHIAVNPCDPSYAVGVWKSLSPPRMVSTTEAGSDGTWSTRAIPDGPFGDPTLAFHPFGAFAYNGAQGGGGCPGGSAGNNGVRRVSTSSVSGFSYVVFEECNLDRTWVAAGPSSVLGSGTVYLYFAFTDARVGAARPVSIARADTDDAWNDAMWEHAVFVSPTDGTVPAMTVGPAAAVHLVYVKILGIGGSVMHTFSTQDGAPTTWSDPPQVVQGGPA